MSSSWGHTVRLATDDERAHLDAMIDRFGPRFYGCSTRNCDEPVTHFVGYLYVTGRAGRVSSAEKGRCEKHARAFATKNGVEMPVAASSRTSRTGYMAVSEAIEGMARDA